MPHKKKTASHGIGPHKAQPISVDTQLHNDLTEVEHLIEKVTINITSGKETPEEIHQALLNMMPELIAELEQIIAGANKKHLASKKEVYRKNEFAKLDNHVPVVHIESGSTLNNNLPPAATESYGEVTATSTHNAVSFNLETERDYLKKIGAIGLADKNSIENLLDNFTKEIIKTAIDILIYANEKRADEVFMERAEDIVGGIVDIIVGITGIVTSYGYMTATGGIGAPLGGIALFNLSAAEAILGTVRIIDAVFSEKPHERVQRSNNLFGFLANAAGSEHAEGWDAAGGFFTPSISVLLENKVETYALKTLTHGAEISGEETSVAEKVFQSYTLQGLHEELVKTNSVLKQIGLLTEFVHKDWHGAEQLYNFVAPIEKKPENKMQQKIKNKQQNKKNKNPQERKQAQNKKPAEETASTTKKDEIDIYKHKVLAREQLSTIAKNWDTTEDELRRQNNLSLYDELKIGSEIIYKLAKPK